MVVLPGRQQEGDERLPALRVQQLGGMRGVITGVQRNVEHFFERVAARLAALDLQQVEQRIEAVQHQVVEAQEDFASARASGRAAQAFCAARARSAASVTSAGVQDGTVARHSPVNGA